MQQFGEIEEVNEEVKRKQIDTGAPKVPAENADEISSDGAMDFEDEEPENNEMMQDDFIAFETKQQVSLEEMQVENNPYTTYAFQSQESTFFECVQDIEQQDYTED